MATLELPNRYLALSPIIVTSPTTRCGTTLVQRLVSTSDNALLYGEEIGLHIRALTEWFVGLMQHHDRVGEALDADFQRALTGALNDWRPGLMPPTSVTLRAFAETYYQIPATLAEYGRSIGRPVWGFKGPAYSRDTIRAFLSLMPRAKVIYVFRNPFDALKSAKARKFADTDEGVAGFCSEWTRNMREVSSLGESERLLLLKYEDLIEQPKAQIRRVELFTETTGIDEAVLDIKINTFSGEEADGHSPSQYIQPAKLTAAETETVLAQAGAVVTELYGDLQRWTG